MRGSNPRPHDYESGALPAVLIQPISCRAGLVQRGSFRKKGEIKMKFSAVFWQCLLYYIFVQKSIKILYKNSGTAVPVRLGGGCRNGTAALLKEKREESCAMSSAVLLYYTTSLYKDQQKYHTNFHDRHVQISMFLYDKSRRHMIHTPPRMVGPRGFEPGTTRL